MCWLSQRGIYSARSGTGARGAALSREGRPRKGGHTYRGTNERDAFLDIKEVNRKVIEQFRAGGEVDGMHRERLVLLTTVGRRTGQRRTTPMMFHRDGDRLLVIASDVGAPEHPAWYLDLVADPRVIVEVGDETYDAVAIPTEGEERARLWPMIKRIYPFFADHDAKNDRAIPVVAITRA